MSNTLIYYEIQFFVPTFIYIKFLFNEQDLYIINTILQTVLQNSRNMSGLVNEHMMKGHEMKAMMKGHEMKGDNMTMSMSMHGGMVC